VNRVLEREFCDVPLFFRFAPLAIRKRSYKRYRQKWETKVLLLTLIVLAFLIENNHRFLVATFGCVKVATFFGEVFVVKGSAPCRFLRFFWFSVCFGVLARKGKERKNRFSFNNVFITHTHTVRGSKN
jgi:hypothetical protein